MDMIAGTDSCLDSYPFEHLMGNRFVPLWDHYGLYTRPAWPLSLPQTWGGTGYKKMLMVPVQYTKSSI
jgi:hypothetical protein